MLLIDIPYIYTKEALLIQNETKCVVNNFNIAFYINLTSASILTLFPNLISILNSFIIFKQLTSRKAKLQNRIKLAKETKLFKVYISISIFYLITNLPYYILVIISNLLNVCAVAYLQTLIQYFRQSFKNDQLMNEIIRFKRNEATLDEIETKLKSVNNLNDILSLKLNGSIGDDSDIEIDFANQDIGFGITGTQEEILFGSSPELCISMLFCDTLEENEGISITGARRVSVFDGYGLNVTLKYFLPIDHQLWRNRVIIAIDALDLSDYVENSFQKQSEPSNLKRELVKAYAGFSCVANKKISTGHWGCGAFNGDKQLKALIQIIAASVPSNTLIFYCRGDSKFFDRFSNFKNDSKAFDLWINLLKGNINDNFLKEINIIFQNRNYT